MLLWPRPGPGPGPQGAALPPPDKSDTTTTTTNRPEPTQSRPRSRSVFIKRRCKYKLGLIRAQLGLGRDLVSKRYPEPQHHACLSCCLFFRVACWANWPWLGLLRGFLYNILKTRGWGLPKQVLPAAARGFLPVPGAQFPKPQIQS